MIWPPPRSPLFPYTTLFRSRFAEVPFHDFAERVPGIDLQRREDLIGLLVESNGLHAFVQWTHERINLAMLARPFGRSRTSGRTSTLLRNDVMPAPRTTSRTHPFARMSSSALGHKYG